MKFVKLGLLTSAMALAAGTVSAGEIAVIVKTTSSNFWQNVNKGASAAIEGQSEHTMSFDGPATESAISDQVNLVENAINRGVSGIVLAPSDPEALAPAVKRAYESGIPVVIIDSALGESAEGTYQAFLSTDNCAAGEQVAQRMIEEAGTEGKVAIMSYVAGVGSEIGRVGCFTDYVEANSNLEIVGPYYSQSQMANALNQTTDVLSANPELVGIFGANEPTAVGMGRALVQSGKAGQLVALGFDGNADLQEFVRDGVLEAIAVQGSFAMGEMGVNTVIDLLEGESVDDFINTGVVMVDDGNIDSDKAQNVLY
ncbi:ABC transporter substrate-binding protein [Allosediminivita pacifica]|uniref:Monosaccharide ABC transporter substrate-binding protein (CUT2 family) n=1 Tax=Allosediminivita pacifica TaxID=1267769 RepID=A0A2T6AQ07_9RHOB|nr:ABC transporter substrate-binding protein [Allosediminivita pacifica]PTX45918.1 monosaccharide ABC transporter substrate-binding protein (CUT2 family) [Allosediminivita pacifica]GGB19090.1 LacI family transcriptional regulator [Allosediminivita pacifica]